MIDDALEEAQIARARDASVDWRNAYVGPDGDGWMAYPDEAAREIGARSLPVQALATISAAAEPLRVAPSHRAELVSELRGGEWLRRILVQGDWSLVQGEDDYVGWVANWSVVEQSAKVREEQLERRLGSYAHPLGTLWASDHWASAPLWLGTPLLRPQSGARERGGKCLVELATGESGWLEETDIAAPDARDAATVALDTARTLLGTPYRWGGKTPTSLDCSALVQLCYERAGIRLPRDAAQQQRCGDSVGLGAESWLAGDLIHFGDPADHVGIYDGRKGMLHCRGRVRRDLLETIPELMERCSSVRRVSALTGTQTLWYVPRESR